MNLLSSRALSRLFLLGLFCWLVGASVPAAHAVGGAQYLSLRKKHSNPRLTYAAVSADPAAFVGQVIELRGTVGGTVETDESIAIMLNLPDNSAVNLDLPTSEAGLLHEYGTLSVRVLAQVMEGSSGNVAVLKALALARDSEVVRLEREAAARLAAKRARAQAQRSASYAGVPSAARRGAAAYRGGFRRGGSRLTESDAAQMAQYYQVHLSERARPLFQPYFLFIAGQNARLTREMAGQITAGLLYFSDQHGVDPRLVVAMIVAESNFDPNATSRVGAMGLGQLMPGTAQSLGVNNAYDPVQNLAGSIGYLRSRLNNFSYKSEGGQLTFEQIRLALAAYNAGLGAVKKHGGIPPYRETQNYIRRVESLYRQLIGQ